MKKLLALILALAMCLPLCACSVNEPAPSDTTEATTTEPLPTDIDILSYKIIRPDNSGPSYLSLYADFLVALKEKTGNGDLALNDDFVREGTMFVEEEYELLLGPTNREESSEALEGLQKTDYVVKIVGTKIVVNGGTRLALGAALEAFIEQCVVKDTTKIPEAMLSVSGNYMADSYYPVLEGIRLTAMGDSYFGGSQLGKDGVWLKLLADEYDMTLNNYGIGGSTVAYIVDANGKTHNPMCDRLNTMKAGADVVIIEGGRNDYNYKVPLGDIDSRDKNTFAGALNLIIENYKEKYPEAMLMGVTCWYVNDAQQKYADMMMAVCEAQGIVCFNASDQQLTGVYMNDASFRKEYCQTETDVSHLNAAGMELVEPVFEKWIAEEYEKFLANNK